MSSTLFCDSCGARNRAGARFCKACGTPLPGDDGESTTVSTPPPTRTGVPHHLSNALSPDYNVEALIGKGGMGEVYRAREVALDRRVAVKVLPADLASEKQTIERFIREARIAAKLQHPNIISIHAVGTRESIHFFTMDLIKGETLTGRVIRCKEAGGLSAGECRGIIHDIAGAIDHAHQKGIIHRDLKPGNVMIEKGGRVLVMDFGLAKATESSQLTVSGAMLGTPRYMSPEQAQGEPIGPPSDIYSLGLIYYYLFIGDDLVQASSLGAVVGMHLSADLKGKVQKQKEIPRRDRDLVCKMIERNPGNRPKSAGWVAEELAAERSVPQPRESEETKQLPSAPSPTPPPHSPTPTPGTPARKKARKRMQELLDKLNRSTEGNSDD